MFNVIIIYFNKSVINLIIMQFNSSPIKNYACSSGALLDEALLVQGQNRFVSWYVTKWEKVTISYDRVILFKLHNFAYG